MIDAVKEIAATISGFAEKFTSKEIRATNLLCIGETCMTENQLKALLAGSAAASTPPRQPPIEDPEPENAPPPAEGPPASDPAPVEEPEGSPEPIDEPVPLEPEASSEPDPAPELEPANDNSPAEQLATGTE